MRNKLFLLMAAVLMSIGIKAANEVYTAFDIETGVLTYYYDDQRVNRQSMGAVTEIYAPEDPVALWRFENYGDLVTKVAIDASMKKAGLTLMTSMFMGLFNAEEVTGMENLVTDEVTDMSSMFSGCSSLTSIDLSHFNTANVTDMNNMFNGCSNLMSLDLSTFNTTKVTDMSNMFGCPELMSLDLSSFNTDNVTNMAGMFNGCSNLKSIDLHTVYTENVTDMNNMFYNCSSLTQLNLGTINTAKVTNMQYMFAGCSSLSEIDVTGFDTKNVTEMWGMFYGCSSLTSLNVSLFDTRNVTDMRFMFSGCSLLTELDLSNFNTDKVTNMSGMFESCFALNKLNISSFNTSNVKDMNAMFIECRALTELDLSHFDTEKVTSMSGMFYACSKLASINLSSFDTRNVTSMRQMFLGCPLTSLNLLHFNTAKVKDMKGMFANCIYLTSVELGSFNTANVTDMSNMFFHCYKLVAPYLNSFDISNVKKMDYMFEDCTSMRAIWCESDWSKSTVLTSSVDMFKNCTSLKGSKGTQCDGVTHIDKEYAHLDEGTSNPGYFSKQTVEVYTVYDSQTKTLTYYYDGNSQFQTGVVELYAPTYTHESVRFADYHDQVTKVVIAPSMKNAKLTSTKDMFYGGYDTESKTSMYLSNMTEIEGMENLVTDHVTDMQRMFIGCSSLTSLDLSHFNTANVTDMWGMFEDCSSLTSLDLRSFNVAKVENMGYMFDHCSSLRAILCDDDWSQSSVLTGGGAMMFNGCTSLSGGNGTSYNSENPSDVTYAHPDGGKSNPGYFFHMTTEVYTAYDELTQTLTYYYDDQRFLREGVTEVYDPINELEKPRFKDYHKQVKKVKINASMKNAGLTSTSRMFYGGAESEGETTNLYTLSNMTEIEGMENLVTDKVTDMSSMFYGCSAMTTIDLSHLNTANVTNMMWLFRDCQALTSLDFTHFSTIKAEHMDGMFYYCSNLKTIDVNNFNTDHVKSMSFMFSYCTSLTELDLNSFNIINLEDTRWMFYASSNLQTIWCSNDWSQSEKLSVPYNMFQECTSLKGGRGTQCDGVNNINKEYARPDGGTSKPGYFFDPAAIPNQPSIVTDYESPKDESASILLQAEEGLPIFYAVIPLSYDENGKLIDVTDYSKIDFKQFEGKFDIVPEGPEGTSVAYKLVAYADNEGILSSYATQTFEFNLPELIDAPDITSDYKDPKAESATVTVSAEDGAKIYYKVIISDQKPSEADIEQAAWKEYTEPFTVTPGTDFGQTKYVTVLAYAEKNGVQSETATAEYEFSKPAIPAKPVISSNYSDPQDESVTVTVSADKDTKIWYKVIISDTKPTDSDIEQAEWKPYTDPITVTPELNEGETKYVTILAYADNDGVQSEQVKAEYEFKLPELIDAPVITSDFKDPKAESATVTVSAEDGAKIYYKVFISDQKPSEEDIEQAAWKEYTEPFTVTPQTDFGQTKYVTVIAYAEKNGVQSETATTEYVFSKPAIPAKPVISSNYSDPQDESVTVTVSADKDTKIWYKVIISDTKPTDSDIEQAEWKPYTEPITVTPELNEGETKYVTILAYADNDGVPSETEKVEYEFSKPEPVVCPDFKLVDEKGEQIGETVYAVLGEPFVTPKVVLLTEGYKFTVSYSSSDEEVAAINDEGEVEIVGAGEATIWVNVSVEGISQDDCSFDYLVFNLVGEEPEELEPLPDDKETTFDFSVYDPSGSEILGVTLGAKDEFNEEEGRVEVTTTNTVEEIDQKLNEAFEGAASLRNLMPGTITFELAAGEGTIEIDCKTMPGFILKVRIAEYGEAYITSTVEQASRGKATINYSVSQKTYVVIYLEETSSSSSQAPARIASSDKEEGAGAYVYSIKVTPKKATTDIDQTPTTNDKRLTTGRKLLIDGVLYIERNGKRYDATGQQTK